MRLLIVALQGFDISLYSVVELQRPGGEKSDWLVQCKQCKHGLISKITMFNATLPSNLHRYAHSPTMRDPSDSQPSIE